MVLSMLKGIITILFLFLIFSGAEGGI